MTKIIEFFINVLPGILLVSLVLSFIGLIGMIVNIRTLLIVDGPKKVFSTIIILLIVLILSFMKLLFY